MSKYENDPTAWTRTFQWQFLWRGLVWVFLGLTAAGLLAQAEVPVYRDEPSGQLMKDWLVCGPFPLSLGPDETLDTIRIKGFYTDYLASHGGELTPRIEEGQIETVEGVSATWKRYHAPEDYVDFDEALTKEDAVVGYAYCAIEMPTTEACALALGSNDGVQVWVNGERVWDHPGGRGLRIDDDIIPVVLQEGLNTLLVKVEERGNRWQLACRLVPFDSDLVLENLKPFRVFTGDDGIPHLRYVQTEKLVDDFITSVHLKALLQSHPDRVVWQGSWSKERETVIPVDTSQYEEYLFQAAVTFAGDKEVEMEVPFTAGKRIEHELFANGATAYHIILGADVSDSERWAADELSHWLKEVSGAEFPVQGLADNTANPVIVVGFNDRAKTLLPDAAAPSDTDESFCYRNVGSNVLIWGGKDRGTMYGVMSFLERELGCRWYTPSVTVTPKKDRYAFVRLDHTEAPGIRVRNDFYFEAFEPIWAARNRINGAMSYREQPGGVEGYWAVHTFYQLMPPNEFFADHPEYFSLLDGKRTADHAQLCLTNPDVLRIMTERIKKVMRENPEYLIYSVSQNDWSNPCQCDPCQAIVDREGSQSGPIIWFVNQVAENIEPEFPDKFIGTLAYSYTRKPCATLKPRENVVVRFCSIECCFAHDFLHCPENASFVDDTEGWAKIAPHIYIWDYVVNFSHYIMPYPNFRVLQPNIQFFRDHNAIGIMEQAAYQSRGGEFAELRMYLISKLLWDPECDVDAVINDFMYGYYGRSGQYVRQYFDLLHGRLTPNTHIHLGLQPDDVLFSDEFVREAEAIFDEAETVADTPEIRERVEMARLPVMYLKCKRSPAQAISDGTLDRFTAIAKREGVAHFAEAGEPHRNAFYEQMKAAE